MNTSQSFANHLLIAMPALQDAFFAKSVIYIHEHSPKGAMGIAINQPLKVSLENLLQHLGIEPTPPQFTNIPVLAGGPINVEQGFVIYSQAASGAKQNKLTISASKALLRKINEGSGPEHFIVALGYTSWSEGQLEQEINRNNWLIVPLDQSILFSAPIEKRWQKAAESIGVNIHLLSDQTGHA